MLLDGPRIITMVVALIAAGVLAATAFLGAPATSSAASPTFACTSYPFTFYGISAKDKHDWTRAGYKCYKQ